MERFPRLKFHSQLRVIFRDCPAWRKMSETNNGSTIEKTFVAAFGDVFGNAFGNAFEMLLKCFWKCFWKQFWKHFANHLDHFEVCYRID